MTTLVFDLDDTLYTLLPTFEKALADFLPSHNYDVPAFYKIFREEGLRLYEASQTGDITMDEYHIYRTIQAFERVGIVLNEDQAETFHQFYELHKKDIELDDMTAYVLGLIKQRDINTGIITNGNVVKQTNTMNSLKVEKYFDKDSILISGSIGIEKPEADIFKAWEKQTGTTGQIVYIGDNFEKDVVGAYNAGWIPVWYNPNDLDAPRNDFHFYDIKQLADVLVLPLFEDENNLNYH